MKKLFKSKIEIIKFLEKFCYIKPIPNYINNIQNIIQKQQMKILQNNRKGISKCQNIKQYGQQ